MPPPNKYIQQIRLDGVVRKVFAKERNGQVYVLLNDIRDVFEDAKTLWHDGTLIPFMTDDDDNRIMPLRIEYYGDLVLDVVAGPLASEPISIPSPRSTAPTTPSSSFTSSVASPLSMSPVSVAPLNIRQTIISSLSSVPEAVDECSNAVDELRITHARDSSVASSSSTSLVPEEDRASERYQNLDTKQRQASFSTIRSQDDADRGDPKISSQDISHIYNTNAQTVHTTPLISHADIPINYEAILHEQQNSQGTRQLTPQSDVAADSRFISPHPNQIGGISQQRQSQLHLQQQYQQSYQHHYQQYQQQQQFYPDQQHPHYQHHYQPEQYQNQHHQYQQQQQQPPPPPPPHYHYQQQQQQQQRQQQQQQQLNFRQNDYLLYQPNDQNGYPQQNIGQYQGQSSSNAPDTPPVPPRPQITAVSNPPSYTFQQSSATNGPHALDPDGRALLASSPTAGTISFQPSFDSIHHHLSTSPTNDRIIDDTRSRSASESGLEFINDSEGLNRESETRLKSLEMKLRRAQEQALAYAKKNHALARESQQISRNIMRRATLIQNKVQAVLMQNFELHENPFPRLFIVLPVLILDQATPVKPNIPSDQRKFRLHFLCECGRHTGRPASGLNHIHFVEHDGYEISRPVEFFEKYGAFIRSLSHLIRNGVNCGPISIPPILKSPEQHQQYYNQSYSFNQEHLKNQILDTRLAEVINYLDSLEVLDPGPDQDHVEYFDGKDIRQLQAYIKIPQEDLSSLANQYRIVTSQGYVKWVCEEHYQSTIHHPNELALQRDITALGGSYDMKVGRAKLTLGTSQEAAQFYKSLVKAHNLQELNIGLNWAFNEGDLSKFVYAVNESKIRVLSLDGHRSKSDTSMKLMKFGNKYDPLLRIIFDSKITSLKLVNIPSMMLKISAKSQQSMTQAFGIKAIHLENVGSFDTTLSEKNRHTQRTPAYAFLSNILSNFNLSEISIPGMNIRDEGISLLTNQTSLQKSLQRINLHKNGISPVGGRVLASFMSREKAITHLDLGMNEIEDEALAKIIEALGPNLTALNLEGTGFRESAAKALDRMVSVYNVPSDPQPHLEFLNLASNVWTTSSIQSLGRVIARLRIENQPPASPVDTSVPRRNDARDRLEMNTAEAFLIVNSMIWVSRPSTSTEIPWYLQSDVKSGSIALTATKDSYTLANMKAQESIGFNSKLKILRITDARLSEGAAKYLISNLDMSVVTKLDLRSCRMFKPREILTMLIGVFPNSSYAQEGEVSQRRSIPSAPTPLGMVGSPQNSLRFIHLNGTMVDDHVADIISQDLETEWCCIEKLDIGNNSLTHKGIAGIMNALCSNSSLQHLNLGQNFSATNTSPTSHNASLALTSREAFLNFMGTNKTLKVLYYIRSDIETVAKGLNLNSTIQSLIFDRLEGTLDDLDAFGRALVINQTLMRFKVYDNRQPPFLQAYFGAPTHQQSSSISIGSPFVLQSVQPRNAFYVDPFEGFKPLAIKTVEKGITFNESIIEFSWPEMFDRAQAATENLENILRRNIAKLRGTIGENGENKLDDASRNLRGHRGISRGLSILSTSSSLSNSSNGSSSSMTSSLSSSRAQTKNPGNGDNYTYSIHSNSSHASIGGASNGTKNSISGNSGQWDERRLSSLELSSWTLNQLRSPPNKEQQQLKAQLQQQYQQQQQQQLQQQQQQRKNTADNDAHIFQRFNKR